jgi:gamma-glutamyl hercynylcysteine S-oxide synthase
MENEPGHLTKTELVDLLREARTRTLELIADLSDEQMIGPRLTIVNPLRWEVGHIAWFQERWALRHLRGERSLLVDNDHIYDSAVMAHDIRWELPLLSRASTLAYMERVLESIVAKLSELPTKVEVYFHLLSLYHEYMHSEAITYTRQTLCYRAPRLTIAEQQVAGSGPYPGDVEIAGGEFLLGATHDLPFVFDNEKWAHRVTLAPFRIARAAVTNQEFAAFVDDSGYTRREWWSKAGWQWRKKTQAEHPVYWQREANARWYWRKFAEIVPLAPYHPVLHINWFEAEAYCRWAKRRLPSEAEWEMAAADDPNDRSRKRRYPWGDTAPTAAQANLDWRAGGTVDVGAYAAGDSAHGCRQMIGNVWEWTASDFQPYPGFVPDPYKEYSQPWFSTHKVLRGGCWATRAQLLRNSWRNFYTPDRRDVWAGFRTCAL